MKIRGEDLAFLNHLLSDHTEKDREIIKKEIEQKLEVLSFHGRSYLPGAVFLITKCPSFSDQPIPLHEINEKINSSSFTIHGDWRKKVSILSRSNLFKECPITPPIIAETYTQTIIDYAKNLPGYRVKLTPEDDPDLAERIKNRVKELYTEKVRLATVGKNPYIVYAGLIYFISIELGIALTQSAIAEALNVTTVSIRDSHYLLRDVLKEEGVLLPSSRSRYWGSKWTEKPPY